MEVLEMLLICLVVYVAFIMILPVAIFIYNWIKTKYNKILDNWWNYWQVKSDNL